MVREGLGVLRDPGRANAIWRESCGAVPDACTRMGLVYESGRGVEKSAAQAATLFDLACRAGNTDGCANMTRLSGK